MGARRRDAVVVAGLLAGAVALTACTGGSSSPPSSAPTRGTTTSSTPPPVPAPYQAAYATVAAEMRSFAVLSAAATGGTRATTMGSELLTANGNIGTGLLQGDAIDRVDAELDAFRALGVTGVTVDVSFPLLLASTPDSAAYLAFYEKVASAVRSRHMVLSVEENPVFSGTPLTALSISYGGLTAAGYAAEQHAQAQLIIDDLRPDYLTVLDEPDTFSDATGVNIDTPSGAVAFVDGVLDGLHRGGTEVGAGTGNWQGPEIDRALLARTSIDYLDVHVYVYGPAALSNLSAQLSAARSARRPLVMDETWLDKPSPDEGNGPASAPVQLKIKSFSFWEPLDEGYVRSMVRYVRGQRFRYVSFFDGARAFFAYLPWSPALESASYQQFSTLYNQAVAAALRRGALSATGQTFRVSVGAG